VKPPYPGGHSTIHGLSRNLWFVWNSARKPFSEVLNPDLWEETRENPVELLVRLKQSDLESLAGDEGSCAQLARVKQDFDRYMSEKPDPEVFRGRKQPFLVAYFTAECGVAGLSPYLLRRSR